MSNYNLSFNWIVLLKYLDNKPMVTYEEMKCIERLISIIPNIKK